MGVPYRLGELINRTAHSKGGAYLKRGAKSNHYGNDDTIVQRPGLKTGVNNDIFQSEIGSEFGDPGGKPPPRIPWSTPQGFFSIKIFVSMTYGGYAIFVPYVGVEAEL